MGTPHPKVWCQISLGPGKGATEPGVRILKDMGRWEPDGFHLLRCRGLGQQPSPQARGLLVLVRREEMQAGAMEARMGHPTEKFEILECSGLRKDCTLVISQERLRITRKKKMAVFRSCFLKAIGHQRDARLYCLHHPRNSQANRLWSTGAVLCARDAGHSRKQRWGWAS